MKKEYDFTKAEKVKFFRDDMNPDIPIYLEPEIKKHSEKLSRKYKKDISIIVNEVLKENIRSGKSPNP